MQRIIAAPQNYQVACSRHSLPSLFPIPDPTVVGDHDHSMLLTS
jgi:hypothetical protein